ncbi:hypothetical protein DNTS_018967 [Danionella cerebrum]|uniref:C2H2-type domain-containing protein n=1 Tax=Danionella cerebrum TaxID=2873325 RepID=A0A553QP16_9TELE|nr:hypothetical protein DNTS_018967 [Danionella translucida]
MSGLKESAIVETNGISMSSISQDYLNESYSAEDATSGSSMHCQDTMDLLSDQGDLLTSVGFMDSICSDGPAKAAYVNGSTSPHISDEILLDISKNVPGFLPKSLHAQNAVMGDVHFEGAIPLKKEGEITIRQTLTAEDVENRGIWGFDTDSPENTLDGYEEEGELGWNPQREFMKFLWDDDNGLGIERKLSPVQAPVVQNRRQRKDKLVLKIDPSEDPFSDLNFESNYVHPDKGVQTKLSPVKKAHSPKKPSKLQSPMAKSTKYLNGSAESVKHIFPKQTKNPITKTQKMGLITKTLPLDLCSKGGRTVFPQSSGFKEKAQKSIAITSRGTTSSKSFTCKKCGQVYNDRSSLVKHISLHKDKKKKVKEHVSELQKVKDKGKNAKLQCPQCTFGTNCSNTFVLHAKTHEKDKRFYRCNRCEFLAMNELDLKQHVLHKHGVTGADHTVLKSDKIQEYKLNKSISPKKAENKIGKQFIEDKEPTHSVGSNTEEVTPKDLKLSTLNVVSESAKQKSRLTKSPTKVLSKNDDNTTNSDKRGPLRKKKTLQGESKKKRREIQSAEGNTHESEEGSAVKSLNNSLSCETTVSGTGASPPTKKCLKRSPQPKEGNTKRTFKADITVAYSENNGTTNCTTPSLEKQVLKKSPSKRKMSTPFHNVQGQEILLDFPKSKQKHETPKKRKGSINNSDVLRGSNDDLGSDECETNKNASACFLKKHSTPSKGGLDSSTGHIERTCTSPCMFSFKDKESSESISPVTLESRSNVETDVKSCPYCPAVFESGISLSNHIRGHLHRGGLKVRRPRGSTLNKESQDGQQASPQVESEEETPDSDSPEEPETDQRKELICPLCRELFDNRKGLSNHVRGHLKRLGKPTSTLSKSPVIILEELMSNKKEFCLKLQILEKKCRKVRSFHKIRLSNGLSFPSTAKRQKDDKEETKGIETSKSSPPSDLIGILKKRRAHEEAKAKHQTHTARKALGLSAAKDCLHEMHTCKAMANSPEGEHNRKVCGHCNTSFHSGVSLSNHLRAYGQRKRKAVQDGANFDCKQRKQRSRSESKKKMYSLRQSTEEVYRLTCRFCDLVFQGPLSVQEDWIKHLQRHIMNTAVPHTGAGMVEVTSFPKDFCPSSVAHAQPSVAHS